MLRLFYYPSLCTANVLLLHPVYQIEYLAPFCVLCVFHCTHGAEIKIKATSPLRAVYTLFTKQSHKRAWVCSEKCGWQMNSSLHNESNERKEKETHKNPQTEPLSLWHQSDVKILFYNNGNGSLTNVLKVPLLTHQHNKVPCWLINTWHIIMILLRCITTFTNIFTAVFFLAFVFIVF